MNKEKLEDLVGAISEFRPDVVTPDEVRRVLEAMHSWLSPDDAGPAVYGDLLAELVSVLSSDN